MLNLHYTVFNTAFSFSIAINVYINRCLDSIVAGGVKICGLHATVAPRRQQQQSPPTMEEFVFVPYVETECLTANGTLVEELSLSKGTTNKPFIIAASLFHHCILRYNRLLLTVYCLF